MSLASVFRHPNPVFALWTLVGWALGRFIGRLGIWGLAIFAFATLGDMLKNPQALRNVGLLPWLLSVGISALVCLSSARSRDRLRQGPPGRP